jgi:hypothetical protein
LIFFTVFKTVFAEAKGPVSATDSNKLSIGIWRGEIIRGDGNTIPFNFQVRETA